MKLKVISIVIAGLLAHSEQKTIPKREQSPKIYQHNQTIPEERFEECAAENELSVPFYDSACYLLTEKGPCMDGEWFVLDASTGDPICTKRKCEPDWIAYNGECQSIGDTSICPPHTELVTNLLGEGECDCKEGYGRPEGTKECYQLLNSTVVSQGPCSKGQWLVLDSGSLGVVCQNMSCPQDHYNFNDKENNDTCIHIDDSHYECPDGSRMVENFYGKGECEECREYCEETANREPTLFGGLAKKNYKTTVGGSKKIKKGCTVCKRLKLRQKG